MSDLSDAIAALGNATALATARDNRFQTYLDEEIAWQTGPANGGPDGDGKYPFTAPDGTIVKVPSPAAIAAIAEPDPDSLLPSRVGKAGRILAVTTDEAGIEWIEKPTGGAVSTRDVWFNDYYPNVLSTDDDAADALVAAINAGTLANCVVRFAPDAGRGPSGRYLINKLHEFKAAIYLVLDFTGATMRYTSIAAQWKFSEPPLGTSSIAANPSYFIVRGGVHQHAVTDSVGAKPFMWNFQFQSSRIMGTGYAENMRIIPQTEPSHYLGAGFVTRNTWYFSLRNVHIEGKAGFILTTGGDWYGCAIEQRGVCVVTTITENCEFFYLDQVIKWGAEQMTGFEATGLSGSPVVFARGKKVVQGGATGYLSRNDSGYGYTYSMDSVTGTFTTGAAQVYTNDGGTLFGTINITSAGTYWQASEAFAFGGGSTTVNVNYMINYTQPEAGKHTLDIQLTDGHCAFVKGCLKINGNATTMISGFNGQPTPSAYAGDIVMFDMSNGNLFTMTGCTSTTNQATTARPAGTTYTCVRLRNMNTAIVLGNSMENYDFTVDADNTVKDGAVAMNTGGSTGGVIKNTGNRYSGGATNGMRFYGNGRMGTGVDMDDPQSKNYTPTVTSSGGAIGAYTVAALYKVVNGVMTIQMKVTVTNRGTATGTMLISLPNLLTGSGTTQGYPDDVLVPVSVNQVAMLAGYTRSTARVIEVYGDYDGEPFKIGGAYGNYTYRLIATFLLAAQ